MQDAAHMGPSANVTHTPEPIYIIDGARSPFLKMRGRPGELSAADLAVQVGKSLLLRQHFDPQLIDEVVLGCVVPSGEEANIARIVGLRLGCGDNVPAYTVQRNCASGLQALDTACQDIRSGRHQIVLAGGTEAMSRAPLMFNQKMVHWLADFQSAKSFTAKLATLIKFRPQFLAPVIALLQGLTDPVEQLSMGQTAEIIAHQFGITREQMDTFALRSHQRALAAIDNHHLDEIVPVFTAHGQALTEDDGIRRESSLQKLAKLKPYFDKKFGHVTAGNSSQVTDGAALLILASAEAVREHDLPVIGRIVDSQWAALNPAHMGLGPIHAATPLMNRHQLRLSDIDYWEINEAFAGQVLACLAAWEDSDYCKTQLGLERAMGRVDQTKVNIDGGAIALGHPVGSSGARIVLHLVHVLRRAKAQRGIASICIGGGQGGAMLIEPCTSIT